MPAHVASRPGFAEDLVRLQAEAAAGDVLHDLGGAPRRWKPERGRLSHAGAGPDPTGIGRARGRPFHGRRGRQRPPGPGLRSRRSPGRFACQPSVLRLGLHQFPPYRGRGQLARAAAGHRFVHRRPGGVLHRQLRGPGERGPGRPGSRITQVGRCHRSGRFAGAASFPLAGLPRLWPAAGCGPGRPWIAACGVGAG
jgi:hypothetical protein